MRYFFLAIMIVLLVTVGRSTEPVTNFVEGNTRLNDKISLDASSKGGSCLSVYFSPNAVSCGTTQITAQINCSFSGVVQMYIVGNPGNVIVPTGDIAVYDGVFQFDVTVEEDAPGYVDIITTVISTWSDPENCVLDEVCEPSTLVTSCSIPDNNFCEGALEIDVLPNHCSYEIYSNNLWTSSGTDGNCSNPLDNDVFFKFEAIETEATLLFGELPSNSMTIELYESCSGSSIYCISMGSYTNIDLENLEIGNEYYLRVSDLPGDNEGHFEMCLWSTFVCDLSATSSVIQNEQCPGECNGIGNVTLGGGTAPFSYEWSNGNISTMSFNLCPGTYTVEVTDANGCTANDSIHISSGMVVEADAGPDLDACAGVPITLQASGGTQYSWSPSTGLSDSLTANPTATIHDSMRYTLLVTNELGCQDSDTLFIFVHPNPSPSITGDSLSCYTDSLFLNAGPDYDQYTWNNGDSNQIAKIVASGIYNVMVVDTFGCSGVDTFSVEILAGLNVEKNILHESGNGFSNGSISLSVSGGMAPYNYYWNIGDSTSIIQNLSPGEYSYTIIDSFGCLLMDTVIIDSFLCPEILITAEFSPFICYDQCDGNINLLEIEGAAGPVEILWNTGEKLDSLENLCEGSYFLNVSDSLNCSIQDSFSIVELDEINIMVDEIRHYTPSQSGAIKLDLDGPYQVEWSGPNNYTSNTENIFGLLPGCYELLVIDTISHCTTDTTLCIQDLTTSVESNESVETMFEIYPNPVVKILVIDWKTLSEKQATVQLVSLDGKIELETSKLPFVERSRIHVGETPEGIYLLRINTWQEEFNHKIYITSPTPK